VLTQAPLHEDCPVGQLPVTQVLFSQISPLAQAWLQLPQWSALLAGLAQSPPQSIWGATQLSLHVPPTQASPTTHVVPQLPQFCGSLPRSAAHVSGPFDFAASPAEQAVTA
jgi:hypothetical protein